MVCRYPGACPYQSTIGRGKSICSRAVSCNWRALYGLPYKHDVELRQPQEVEVERELGIVKDYEDGIPTRKIYRKYHIGHNTLYEILRKHDVKLRGGIFKERA